MPLKETPTENTIAAAPQLTNQPNGTEETLIDTHVSVVSVHLSVLVSSSGCLNLFFSHYLATLTRTRGSE